MLVRMTDASIMSRDDGAADRGPDVADKALALVAYPARNGWPVDIRPAPRARDWLNLPPAHTGKHCLPLLVANEAGWELLNPRAFTVTWAGTGHREAITIEGDGKVYDGPAHSGFGAGILSFTVPFVFRTPPGWNLLVRGPANRPKDGVASLEGLIETDWSVATFTMNWQLTRAGAAVRFEDGEPFGMVVPQPRGLLTGFRPVLRDIASDHASKTATKEFARSRRDEQQARFLAENGFGESPPFNRQYFRGRYPDGRPAPEHETKLDLAGFADSRGPYGGGPAPADRD